MDVHPVDSVVNYFTVLLPGQLISTPSEEILVSYLLGSYFFGFPRDVFRQPPSPSIPLELPIVSLRTYFLLIHLNQNVSKPVIGY